MVDVGHARCGRRGGLGDEQDLPFGGAEQEPRSPHVESDAFATGALARGLGASAWLSGLDGYEAIVVDAAGFVWRTPGIASVSSVMSN